MATLESTPAPGTVAQLDSETLASRPTTLWSTAWRRLFRRRSAVAGMVLLGALVLVAIFAPWIAPYAPRDVLLGVEPIKRRDPPCIHLLGCPADQPQHLMGIDGNARDQFSRVIHGSRVSLLIGFNTVAFAIIVGTVLGAIAGYAGGWTDNIIMRLMDVLLAFPSLLLAIAIVDPCRSSGRVPSSRSRSRDSSRRRRREMPRAV